MAEEQRKIEEAAAAQQGKVAEHAKSDAEEATSQIQKVFDDFEVHVPVIYDYQRPSGSPPASMYGDVPSFAHEGYDIGSPILARVGDAVGDTESILHARTVRGIVSAASQAGASAVLSGGALLSSVQMVHGELRAILETLRNGGHLPPIQVQTVATVSPSAVGAGLLYALEQGGDFIDQFQASAGIRKL
jgi:hypothetical protein